MKEKYDCFIFYFDVINIVNTYLKDKSVINQIESWQREVRDKFSFSNSDSTCKTLFDNVWARITTNHPEQDIYQILDFAGDVMNLAVKHGFENYFGAITYGTHEYDILDRTLIGGGNPTDITKQHIDTLGPAHIRAAFAEKWSAMLFKANKHPALNSVWISDEALFGIGNLFDVTTYSNLHKTYNVKNLRVDLNDSQYSVGKIWPFNESKFQFITR